jgi:hypothetical protein
VATEANTDKVTREKATMDKNTQPKMAVMEKNTDKVTKEKEITSKVAMEDSTVTETMEDKEQKAGTVMLVLTQRTQMMVSLYSIMEERALTMEKRVLIME